MERIPRARFVALLLAGSLWNADAHGWGPNGHRVVGQIAENHLTRVTRARLQSLTGPDSLAEISTWPDEIRSDPDWSLAAPWHYISIDDGETFETTDRSTSGDIVEAMGRFEAVLRDPGAARDERAEALRFLVHLVGDVHQPLHVGRRDDLGGNRIRLNWCGRRSNLHAVWDSELLESERLSFSELVRFIDHPTAEEVRRWQGSGYRTWVQESFELRPLVYDLRGAETEDPADLPELCYEYTFHRLPIVKRRLLQAGVRLAGLLESIFAEAVD